MLTWWYRVCYIFGILFIIYLIYKYYTYLSNEFFSFKVYIYFWFSRYIYVRDTKFQWEQVNKIQNFPKNLRWLNPRDVSIVKWNQPKERDIPFPSRTAERRREAVPWRGAWQNYQETIWGRRPMHPDRLRSIYAIRVTKSGTRVDGRNAFENERVREALCIV